MAGAIFSRLSAYYQQYVYSSVVDPDPYVFGPPGSGSDSQRYGSRLEFGSGSGYGSLYHQAKNVRKTVISTVL
jgi:hypothetical protein